MTLEIVTAMFWGVWFCVLTVCVTWVIVTEIKEGRKS